LDDTYQVYVNRVARMTLPESYRSQVQHIQASPKFQQYPDGDAKPVPFPGYSVITPPWVDDAKNQTFYSWLQTYQQQLLQQVEPGVIVPVPADSFHLTLADLIWDSAYHHARENPAFETKLREQITQSFQQCQPLQDDKQVSWQALGLIVMTRAIGVCLVPSDETSYQQVLQMRRSIYQNSNLMGLGIEQQYHFTAHITLGYFGTGSASSDRDRLGQTLNHLNQQELEAGSAQKLWVHRAELRKFDDMTRYYRETDWPVLEF
jgi:hypothetical protein